MKTLSVLLTFALLFGANHLASRLRRAGALPAMQSAAPAAHPRVAAAIGSTFDTLHNSKLQ